MQSTPAVSRIATARLGAWRARSTAVLLTLLALLHLTPAAAAPPDAGSVILNQATASYTRTATGEPEIARSNVVAVEVAAVESLTLAADQQLTLPPGASATLPHTLTNSGNVTSSYRFELTNEPGAVALQDLALVLDLNGNGAVDPGEPTLPIDGTLSELSLAPGESAALLVLAVVPVDAFSGTASLRLTATSPSSSPATASNTDVIRLLDRALVVLEKRTERTEPAYPGSIIGYHITARNSGSAAAAPTAVAAPLGTPILVDGAPATLLLLSDPIPAGSDYVPGSLTTTLPGALLLHRLALDPPFSYRTGDGDDAVELAVGSALPLQPGATAAFAFAVRVRPERSDAIVNRAASHHHDGTTAATAVSNSVTVEVSRPPDLAIAKSASIPRRLPVSGFWYEVEYALTISNPGAIAASHVRVVDNLNCTFRSYQADSPVLSWRVSRAPVAARGILAINPAYTGAAPCAGPIALDDPSAAADENPAVTLTEGTRSLAPGAVEEIVFAVQFELAPLAPAAARVLENVAVALAVDQQDLATGTVIAAALASADTRPTDPSGVIYDAITREPLGGAVVTLRPQACDSGAAGALTADALVPLPGITYTFSGDGGVAMTTGPDGAYEFHLRHPPVLDRCRYGLTVTPPAGGYSWPSSLLPAEPGIAPGGLVQPQSGPPSGDDSTRYFLTFDLGPGQPDVLHNHVPVDPELPAAGLMLQKTGNRRVVSVGETMEYALRVRGAVDTAGLRIVDRLPVGFRYVAGSARLNGAPTADPQGVPGPELVFDWPDLELADDATVELRYRARPSVDAPLGSAVNRATAYSGTTRSNEGAWRVQVEGDVFADEAYLVGKVFLDTNGDGVQGHEEVGVPGVRLFLENGTSVVTDVEGKYSLYGLRPVTHVLKLDTTTLPPGARPLIIDNRNSGRADSRFVDLKKGELHKANFAIEDCCLSGVRDAVERRRKALAHQPEAEGEAVIWLRLEAEPQRQPSEQEVRRRSASGAINSGPAGSSPTAGARVYEPVLPAALAEAAPSRLATPTPAALPTVDLAALVAEADASLAFVDLEDGDTLPMALTHVRVKGRLGAQLQLSVNGQPQPAGRVGKKVRLAERQLEAWEYIGVELTAGDNLLQLDEVDPFGNVRNTRSIRLVAPGAAGRLELDVARTAVADAATPVPVRVRLTDDRGVPVTVRTLLTLEAERGRWQTSDLNPDEPGTQVFISGGEATFALIPPAEPEDARVRVSAGVLSATAEIAFLPELRPLIGAGILEGIIDLRRKGAVPLGRAPGDAFEQTLRNLSRQSSDGKRSVAGRAAFFFKGVIGGEYLLTAAFDSDKDTRERLFRDIQPDSFYPIYGDSAVKTFDAQSTQRLYLRIDHERSYLLYGDFVSGSADEVRRLGSYDRALTGAKYHHETDRISANAFASRDSLRQVVVEIPADGTSGPYAIPGAGELYENSERVEILVRDRAQTAVVLETRALSRFDDYVIEPVSRRLLFKSPVASLDGNLNPRSIRITYEADTGGQDYWTTGADARVKLGQHVELGASAVRDDNPEDGRTLLGVTAVARPGPQSAVIAEVAHSDSDLAESGQAARLEWITGTGKLNLRAQVTVADSRFDNPSSGFSAGRTEASMLATYQQSERTELRAETLYSRDAATGGERSGTLVTATTRLSPEVSVEVGVRATTETSAPADASTQSVSTINVLALRSRLTRRFAVFRGTQGYLEFEQDVRARARRMLALGADAPLGEKTRLYGRYEAISSLGNPFTLNNEQQNNVAIFGLESAYLQQGRLFSEMRLRDSISGREAQAVSGTRNFWNLGDGLRLGASLERTAAFGGEQGNDSAAATLSLNYTGSDRYKLYGSLEGRDADSGDAYLNTLGLAMKLDRDWSLLGRSVLSVQHNAGDDSRLLLSRQQLGFAWRQVDQDRWNALGRYEFSVRDLEGGADPSTTETHSVSMHVHHQAERHLAVSARYGFKWGHEQFADLETDFWAHLLHTRLMWDFAEDWDLSPQLSYRRGHDGADSYAFGIELGYQLVNDLWLSMGYNVVGFDELALAASDYLNRGVYVRIRFKFDEELLR